MFGTRTHARTKRQTRTHSQTHARTRTYARSHGRTDGGTHADAPAPCRKAGRRPRRCHRNRLKMVEVGVRVRGLAPITGGQPRASRVCCVFVLCVCVDVSAGLLCVCICVCVPVDRSAGAHTSSSASLPPVLCLCYSSHSLPRAQASFTSLTATDTHAAILVIRGAVSGRSGASRARSKAFPGVYRGVSKAFEDPEAE